MFIFFADLFSFYVNYQILIPPVFYFRVNSRPYQFLNYQNLTFPFSAPYNVSHFVDSHPNQLSIPAAARSKAWVFCLSLAEIEGSNAAGGTDVCCECCVSSGEGFCDGPILFLERERERESARDVETSRNRVELYATHTKKHILII
jgi:hypothetical protein